MTTVMLVVIPRGAGAGFAGRPLKNIMSGNLLLADGTEIPVNNDIFTAVEIGQVAVIDGKSYIINKISVITQGMGKIVLEPQE
ncbi:MAG: hypothetical protein ACRC6X_06915 [Culicoidibacterales bacterium]